MVGKWRIFVLSAVCVAGLLVFAGFQAVELSESCQSRQTEIKAADSKLAQLKAFQEMHPDLEQYEMEMENRRKNADELLPDNMQAAELLPHLQQNALKAGLELQELLPAQAVKEKGLSALPLQVKVAGDYFGILDFVKSLERGKPFCQITAMELKQEKELSAVIKLQVYSL